MRMELNMFNMQHSWSIFKKTPNGTLLFKNKLMIRYNNIISLTVKN